MEAPAVVAIGPARCASIRCSLCSDLSPCVKEELARLARIRTYKAGETVVAEAEPVGFVGHVVSGVLRMQKALQDGRQQIVGLLLPSDSFGRVFAEASHVAIEAATDVTLCCYNRAGFEALLAKFPELEHRMLLSISRELDAAQDWMLLLATQTVTERVATFLLILAGKSLEPAPRPVLAGTVTIPIARKDMAAYLGTTVESISRSVQELSRRSVIRIVDTQHFEILNPRRLIELSGHDPAEFAQTSLSRRLAG